MQPALYRDESEPLADGREDREPASLVEAIEVGLKQMAGEDDAALESGPLDQFLEVRPPRRRLREAESVRRPREAPVPHENELQSRVPVRKERERLDRPVLPLDGVHAADHENHVLPGGNAEAPGGRRHLGRLGRE